MSRVRRLVPLAAVCLNALVTVGCLAKTDGADSGVGDEGSSEDVETRTETEPEPTTQCQLIESTNNPQVTLSGRLCGETISLTTRAGAIIHLGRSQASDPETEVRVVEVLESANPEAAADFANAGFLVNLAFETGPEVASTVSTHNLTSGVFSLCGFGTVVMQSGPVIFEMSGIEDGARSGDITLTLSGMLVGGFSNQHGQSRVQLCGGELDLTLQGRFVHQ